MTLYIIIYQSVRKDVMYADGEEKLACCVIFTVLNTNQYAISHTRYVT